MKDVLKRTVCVAPMMECTDRHDRYLLRLISRHALLYTEMITTMALRNGDPAQLLAFHPIERPLALQLGGSHPADMAACAQLGERYGYDEINLNVGCPSGRVRSGRFGACLMAQPQLVADCVAAMGVAVSIPITVKTRIGIDRHDSYEGLVRFVRTVARAGCRTLIVHARKAWLSGLSPRQNLEVPPLRHDWVHRLKQDFPELDIVLNGGIRSLAEVRQHLNSLAGPVDGVMIGRQAYHDPFLLASVDGQFYGDQRPTPGRREVVASYIRYMERELSRGVRLSDMTRHMLGLFHGQPGARAWRRHLTEGARRVGAGADVIRSALERVS
jgi:tRNA-dihydrouridine synthase A